MSDEELLMLTDYAVFKDCIRKVEDETKQTIVNLNETAVVHEDSGWYLVNKNQEKKYFLTLNALDQICKLAKVPTNFLIKNPESLSNSLMEYWYPPEVGVEPAVVRYYSDPNSPVPVARGFLPEKEAHDLMGLSTFWETLKHQLSDKANTVADLVYAEGFELPASATVIRFKFVEDPLCVYSDREDLSVVPSITVAYSDCGGLKNFVVDAGYMNMMLPLHTNMVFRPDRVPYYMAKSKTFTSDELDRVLKFTLQDAYRYLWNPEGKKRVVSYLRNLDNKLVSAADFNPAEATEKLMWVEKMLDYKSFPPAILKQFQTKLKENSLEISSMLDVYLEMLRISSGMDMPLQKRANTEAVLTSFFKSIFN